MCSPRQQIIAGDPVLFSSSARLTASSAYSPATQGILTNSLFTGFSMSFFTDLNTLLPPALLEPECSLSMVATMPMHFKSLLSRCLFGWCTLVCLLIFSVVFVFSNMLFIFSPLFCHHFML